MPEPTPDSSWPPVLATRYDSIEPVGRGGVGLVYRARDREGGRWVAIKLIDPDHLRDGLRRRAFVREARAFVRLRHPNVVRLLDFDAPADGPAYLVTEYLGGGHMGQWRARWPGWERLLAATDGVLSALAYTHARGVIHCDLKPENVLFEEGEGQGEGRAKLVDFGVATMAGQSVGHMGRSNAWRVREQAGTPTYMAPEQSRGHLGSFGPWTDLYALGVILYEILAGAPPFAGGSTVAVMLQHLNDPPPPLVWRPGVAPIKEIEALLTRLLAKDPWERPRFAAKVRRELQALSARAQQLDAASFAGGARPRSGVLHVVDEASFASGRRELSSSGMQLLRLKEPELVGRQEETSRLLTLARVTLRSARPALVLLEGPAGIGKSRLAQALLEHLEENGMMQAWSGAYRVQEPGPTTGLLAALDAYLLCLGLDRPQVELTLQRRFAEAGLDPQELQTLVELLRPLEGQPGSVSDEAAVATLCRVIHLTCDQHPLYIWLDDIQHAIDGPLPALLEQVLTSSATLPVPCLIVATLRALDRNTDPTGRLRQRLLTLTRHPSVHRLEVAPLIEADVVAWLTRDVGLDEPHARRIARESDGNPFLALQRARATHALRALGQLPRSRVSPSRPSLGADFGLSSDAHELVDEGRPVVVSPLASGRILADRVGETLERIAEPEGSLMLGMLGLLGAHVRRGVLRVALERAWPEHDWTRALPPLLDAAQDAGLIEWRDDGETIRVDHEPLSRLLCDRLAREGWTRRAHMAAAAALEEVLGHDDPALVAEQARHLARAECRKDAWLRMAHVLKRSLALGRFVEVTRHAREALRWLTDWSEPPDSLRLAEARLALAHAALARSDLKEAALTLEALTAAPPERFARRRWLEAWLALQRRDFNATQRACDEALAAFEATGDRQGSGLVLLVAAELRRLEDDPGVARELLAYAHRCFAEVHDEAGQAACVLACGRLDVEDNPEQAERLLHDAIRRFHALDDLRGRAEARAALGVLLLGRRAHDQARALLTSARDDLERAGDTRGLARALRALARLERAQGPGHAALERLERALQLCEQAGDLLGAGHCALEMASAERGRDVLELAQRHAAHALDLYRRARHPRGVACALITLGNTLLDMGNSQQAMARLEAAHEVARGLNDPHLRLLCLLNLARTQLTVGQLAPARNTLMQGLHLARKHRAYSLTSVLSTYDALAALLYGDQPHADAALDAVARDLARDASPELASALTEAAASLEASPEVEPARQRLLELASRCQDLLRAP